MSDLTFASPQPTSSDITSANVDKQKSNKGMWVNLLVVILVIALLSEAGYFFYNRYISNQKLAGLKNLSTDETMNYGASPEATPNTFETTGAVVSHVGDLSRQKAEATIDAMNTFPEGYVFRSSINMSIQGKVVAVLDEVNEDENVTYVARLRLVNAKGDPKSLLFSDEEMKRMRVVSVVKGVVQKELKYHDIKPGDFVNIHVASDLFDLRNGADDITIEIRTN